MVSAWYNKDIALSRLGRHMEALDCLEKALDSILFLVQPGINEARSWRLRDFMPKQRQYLPGPEI